MQTNRASWSEDRAGTPLGRLLVSPTRQLAPQRAPGAVVGIPQAPPPNIRYGSVPPGIAQSQRFSGGTVGTQPGAMRFNAPPNFVPPNYGTSSIGANIPAVHPLAALAAATSLLGPHPGPAPPPPGQTIPGAAQSAVNTILQGQRIKAALPGIVNDAQNALNSPAPAPAPSFAPTVSAVISALANQGLRPGGHTFQY